MAKQIEEVDPVQAIDHLRRAYLITNNAETKVCASKIFTNCKSEIDRQSKFFINDFLRN